MVRGFGRRAALRAVGSHRRSPLVAGAFREQRISGGWPDGWAAQGTLQVRPCKLDRRIHAAHAPAQPTHPAPDRFLRGQPRKAEQKIKSRSRSLRSSMPDFRCSLVAGQRPALPQSIHAWRGSTADRGNLSGGGVMGASRTVGAMDGAIEPPWMGLRRVLLAPITPPAHGMLAVALAVAVAVAVAVALASAGAGRRPARAHPPLPVQCRARFPTTVPRT